MIKPTITEQDFAKLTKKLTEEIPLACIDYRMYRSLHDACVKNKIVVQQSKAFWPMTLDAHLNSAVLRLCRIYDTQKNSLNLVYWLKLIKEHPKWFTEDAFVARYPERSYHGMPDCQQLDKDIDFASRKNPLVGNLIKFRGNLVAHIGKNYVLKKRNLRESFTVTLGDLKNLANGALTILNRYMNYYEAGEYSGQMIGEDDFQFIFKYLNEVIERNRND